MMGYNLDFLDKDNELRSYFLGLYMADGWMDQKGNFFISSVDKQLIDDLVLRLNYTNIITESKNLTYNPDSKSISYRIGFCKKELRHKMKKLGFTVNKTGHEFIPNCISNETFHHFLRGLSDGDGHFSFANIKSRNTKSLEWGITCASESFLQILINKLRNESICAYNNVSVRKRKNANAYEIKLSHHDSVKLGNFIYNKSSLYLIRKYEKFLSGKAFKCKRNPRWTKQEIEMAIRGIIPKNRTKNGQTALIRKLKIQNYIIL